MRNTKKVVKRAHFKKLVGLSEPQLKKLIGDGLPTKDGEHFDKAKCLQWLSDRLNQSKEPEDLPDTIITNRAVFAKRMGVSVSLVRYWETKDDFPGGPNRYPFQQCSEWRDQKQNNAGRPAKPLSESDKRLSDLKVEKLETEVLAKKGELVPLQEVTDHLRRSVARHREIIRSFPDKLAKRFSERGFDRESVAFCRQEAIQMTEDLQKQIYLDLVEHAEEDIATE